MTALGKRFRDLRSNVNGVNDGLSNVEKNLKQIDNLTQDLSSTMSQAFTIDKDNSIDKFKNALSDINRISQDIKKTQDERAILSKSEFSFAKDSTKASSEQLKTQAQTLVIAREKLKLAKNAAKAQGDVLKAQLATAIANGANMEDQEKIQEAINQNKKAQESFTNAINQSLKSQKSVNAAMGNAKFRETAEKGLGKINTAAKSVSNTVMGAFGISSLNPLTLLVDMFGFAVKAAIDLDTELGNAAKSMNQTYEAAGKSRLAMIDVAQASGELGINATHMQQTFLALNKSLGTGVVFEKMGKSLQKDIGFMAMMENYAGLTAEESNNILKYSLQLGKSAKSTSGILMAQYKASSLKYKIVVNEKDALKEIGKISESIKASTSGGAAGLAKALAAAKGLGVSLNDVENTASSLLNFEVSIEKEMSAELLLGRDLNLEKARQYALNNDMVGVAEEILRIAGSKAEFENMSFIQQQALAAAIGMTREQLAGALNTQEQQKEISKEAISDEQAKYEQLVASHGEQGAIGVMMQQQLALQTQQASSQEKIAQAKLKEKDVISSGLIPAMTTLNSKMTEMIKKLQQIFEKLGGWKNILYVIVGIIGVSMVAGMAKFIANIRTTMKLLKEMQIMQKVSAGIEIVRGSWASLGPAPGVGPLLAAAAIGIGMGVLGTIAAQDMSDGIIPSTNNSGFGDRIMYGPEGAISFNNKDTIVAGTDLFAKKANDYMAPAGNIEMINPPPPPPPPNDNFTNNMDEFKKLLIDLSSRPIANNIQIGAESIIKATTGAESNKEGLARSQNSFELQ